MKAFIQFFIFGLILFAVAGFINPVLFKPLAAPTLSTEPANTITSVAAVSGGNITDNGGAFTIDRKGVVWDLVSNPPPDTLDSRTEDGPGTGPYSSNLAGLSPETNYAIRAWALNSNDDLGYGSEETFWTLSLPPTGAVAATATSTGTTSINLTFNDLATLTDADGYVILRRQGSNPTLTNGTAPNPAWLIQTITTNGVTNYSDMGLNPNATYRYLIAPFNYDNTNDETYNYQTAGNNVMATTDPPASASTITAAGNEAGDLGYINFPSGNINSTLQGIRVWSITIADPGAGDDDGLPTIVDDIIFGEGPSNSAAFSSTLNAAALFEGGAEIADGIIGAGTISFTNINESIAQSSSRTFDLYVSFNTNVNDGEQLRIDINSATTTGVSSDFGALGTVQSTHTAGVSNKIQVVATRLDIVSTPSTVADATDFSLTVRAEDTNNNIDIDATPSVTLTANPAVISSVTGLIQNLTAGDFTWTDVQLDAAAAGSSLVTASAGGLTNATQSIDVEVPGVIVTQPAPIEFCSQFQEITLGDIVITEGVSSDFGQEGAGEQQVYTIRLPTGYRFNGSAGSVGVNETNPGPTDVSTITTKEFRLANSKFQFEYNITGTANKDQITISGLRIEKRLNDQLTNLEIERVASTLNAAGEIEALHNGNGPTQQPHATINFGGVNNATLIQVGGTSSFCIGVPVTFEASGGDNYEFFITPDGGSNVSKQDGPSDTYITVELVDLDSVSVIVTNTATGCTGTIGLPKMVSETEPIVTITQPSDGDILVQGSEPISLVAEDSVGAAVTTNGGTFTGPFVQDLGGNNFSFNPSTAGIYNIFYDFSSASGCTDRDTVQIEVQDFGPKLIANLADQYCNDEAPVPLIWDAVGLGLTLCSISGPGVSGNITTGYTFDPANAGTVGTKEIDVLFYRTGERVIVDKICSFQCWTISSFPFIQCGTVCNDITVPRTCSPIYFSPITPGKITIVPPTVFKQQSVIFDVPNVGFETPINPYYCEDDNIFTNGNFAGGDFKLFGPGVQGDTIFRAADVSGEANFNIIGDGVGVGLRQLSYTFSDPTNGGCENTITTAFEVLAVPPDATTINVPDSVFYCIGDFIAPLIGVSDDSTVYTLAWFDEAFDPIPLDTGLVFDISFIDSLTSSVNTFYVGNAHKVFPDCEGVRQRIVVTVGVIPDADFQVTGLCRSDSTRFVDLSTISQGTVDTWMWDFGDGFMSTEQNPVHKYAAPGTYTVTMTARSERNCEDILVRDVTVFPEINASSFPYLEQFNTGANGWVSKALEEQLTGILFPNSWLLKSPDGTKIQVLDGDSWLTDNGSITYEFLEKSWVECPCLDLSALDRPMVSFDIWTDTELGVDGAVLQITTDDGLTWNEVGDDQSGVNWYDARGLPGNPGQQSVFNFGWSGIVKEWRTAKYALNQFLDSLDANSRVRLRVAFGSNLSNPGQSDFGGIAFDNFFIGNRNRKVLIEHFTNLNAINYAAENTVYNDFVTLYGDEIVNLRYHMDFPDPDNFYLSDPAIPGARAIFYGVSETSNNAIDGLFDPRPLADWGDIYFNERTLEAAPYQIDMTFNPTPVETLDVDIILSTDLTFAALEDTLDLYVAVVETFPDMTNIVRQMLPDVSGTRINWPAGDTVETYSFSQKLTNIDDPANLSIIAFLQDANSKEIMQAEDSIPPALPAIVTGINDGLGALDVNLYPNPTRGVLNVSFGKPLVEDTRYEIYNTFGQLAGSGTFVKGRSEFLLPEKNFAQGVYILKLREHEDSVILRKFLVIK